MKKNLPSQNRNVFASRVGEIWRYSILSTGFCFLVLLCQGQSQLLKDINVTEDVVHNEFGSLTAGDNKVYLTVNSELWKTTGNEGGTVKLKAFKHIKNLISIGSTLYFSADDGSGIELWKSTGTSATTTKVKDFVSGTSGGNPEYLTNVNGTLYFVAYTVANGRELWKSDGTESGTVLVKDILRIKGSSNPAFLTHVNGTLYFAANDGQNGYEIWKSDGTTDGTQMVIDVRPGKSLSSTPEFLTNVNGTLFFVASDGVSGRELWKTEGTTQSSMRLKDIRPGSGSALIKNMTAVNNTLFFTANDGIHGFELWKSDGSKAGTSLVKDMTPGPQGSHGEQAFSHQMGNFKSVFGLLFFTAYENDIYYIWKSDGTEAGTVPLQTAFRGISMPAPRFVPKGNYIYYFNFIPEPDEYIDNSFHLYRMNPDGSNQTIITALHQDNYYSSYDPELIAFKSSLYFSARRNSEEGFKLFRSDGTPGSIIPIKDAYQPTFGSELSSMVKTGNNKVFFMAAAEMYSNSQGLWTTNGTPEGTIKLKEMETLNSMVATGTHVYFSVNNGFEIWKSDGTVEGTLLVKADPTLPKAYNLVNVKDMVYFQSYNAKLWRTDGTEAGTIPLPMTGSIYRTEAVGDLLYFTTSYGSHFRELWRTNGLPGGTYSIYSFPGNQQPLYSPTAVSGNVMYFVADDGISGNEVWRTNGTTQGTYQVADLHPNDDHLDGPYENDIRSLEIWNKNLYIGAYGNTENWALFKSNGTKGNAAKVIDLIHPVVDMIPVGDRLHFFASTTSYPWYVNNWITDGTTEGTQLLNDYPFTYTFWAFDYTVLNNILFYNAYEKDLWRSDGTVCGTYSFDLGVYGSYPMENIGNTLVFGGSTAATGFEPYSFNLSKAPQRPCGIPMMLAGSGSMDKLIITQEEDINAPYPNPFNNEFSFRVNEGESDVMDIEVFTSTGYPVEKLSGLKTNTDYKLGNAWPVGLYILNIKTSGKITAQKVLKK